jgi:hypothetical protein
MIALINFLLCIFIHGEGFAPQTLVKTPYGYCAIESLQVNELVVCCDVQTNTNYVRPITTIEKNKQIAYVTFFASGFAIIGDDQLIYIPILEKWIPIQEFLDNEWLLQQTIIKKVLPFKSETLISLSIADFHNFYVTIDDILVHNAPVVFIATAAAESLIPLIVSSGTFGAVATYLGIEAFREHRKKKKIEHIKDENEPRAAAGGAGRPPDDPNDPYKNKDTERFTRRDPDHHITNKEAREVAKQLGYWEVKNPPFATKNIVFYNGIQYISPDIDGHSGGFWKVLEKYKGKRIATYDKLLRVRIGK